MLRDASGETYFVFDDHTHMGRRATPSLLLRDQGFDAAAMVADMDRCGVDMVVAFPRMNPHTDYSAENDQVLGYAAAQPTRIVPFARINPFFRGRAIEQIHTYAKRGCKGLKFQPYMDFGGVPVNSPDFMFPLMEAASANGLPVLIHSGEAWSCTPALIADLASHFPNIPFIVGHSGLWEFHQEAIVAALQTPNLFLDTAEVAPPGVVTQLVRRVGSDRVMYGSDHPMIPFGWELRKVVQYAGLSAEEIRPVVGENLLGLLNLERPDEGSLPVVDLQSI